MWTNENRGRHDRSRLRYPSDLTDDEWNLVECLIPPGKRGGDKRTVIMREVVNNRDRNFTRAKMERRMAQIEESVARYLQQLDSADRQEPCEALKTKTSRLKEKIAKLKEQMQRLEILTVRMLAAPDQQISLTDPDARSMATSGRGSGVVGYNVQVAVDTQH